MPADAAAVGRERQGTACGRFAMSQIAATTVSVPRISRPSNPCGPTVLLLFRAAGPLRGLVIFHEVAWKCRARQR